MTAKDRSAASRQAVELPGFSHHESSVEEMRALYTELHAQCPVVHSDALGGFYMVTGYDEVRHAAANWEEFSSAGGMTLPKAPFRIAAIEFDPPHHAFWRDLYREVLNLATYRSFEDRVVELTNDFIDRFAHRREADLLAELTDPLPVAVICEILGIHDHARAREARRIALEVFDAASDPEALPGALGRYAAFCLREISERRDQPRQDFLTRLATGEVDGQPLGDDVIVNLLIGFLIAGHHTTSSVMTNMLLRLAQDQDLQAQALDDPSIVNSIVEETIRLDTPLHGFFRQTTREVVLGGVAIPEGSEVMLNYAAANRDPHAFEDADTFDPRRAARHLGFGHGIHSCVGAQLGRLELRIALREVVRRLRQITLTDNDIRTLWIGGNLHMIDRLPVRFVEAT